MPSPAAPLPDLPGAVAAAVRSQKVYDMHTHLYPPGFGTPLGGAGNRPDERGLMLWGIDALVTYHYLVAEVYRVAPPEVLPYEKFWSMNRARQADHIWQELFVKRTPISEACRGVLTTLQQLGLDPNEKSLAPYRAFFNAQDPDQFIDKVMELAGVDTIVMTNPVFDDNERRRWLDNPAACSDSRFRAVLRVDPLLRDFPAAAARLRTWGHEVADQADAQTLGGVREFLHQWLDRQKAIYVAVSLPPDFRYPCPAGDAKAAVGQAVLEQAILPVCAERKLPFAMMIGSRLRVNPDLRDGGDMSGIASVESVVELCRRFPKNKFLVTMLARENQHELCVAARKFSNLMIFGCWWFLNNPSLIDEITRMRVELLGTSFIPQHSDARILDQLVYKWRHSREIISRVLAEKYADLAATGRTVTKEDIARDARLLLHDNFAEFCAR